VFRLLRVGAGWKNYEVHRDFPNINGNRHSAQQ